MVSLERQLELLIGLRSDRSEPEVVTLACPGPGVLLSGGKDVAFLNVSHCIAWRMTGKFSTHIQDGKAALNFEALSVGSRVHTAMDCRFTINLERGSSPARNTGVLLPS